VGIWYEVEPALVADPQGADARILADFAAIGRLGLGTVFLRQLPDDLWQAACAAADSVGLQAVRPDPRIRFVTPAATNAEVDESAGAAGRPVLNLRCEAEMDEDPSATTAQWWRQFHAGLAQGLTGGLAFDQFRGPPDALNALAGPGGSVSVERQAAVKRIAARMRAWGTLLHRLELQPPPGPGDVPPELGLTLFARGPRRLLLLVNGSESRVLRAEVILPKEIGGLPADRLVEIPAEGGLELGTVARAGNEGTRLRLELAPGEARLFEVFGPASDRVSVGGP
jgi:hypothetical protein